MSDSLRIVPITLRVARDFVAAHHRHNKPPRGWKFGVGLRVGDDLVGVATAGRPVARHFDDGLTLEVNRTCTDGTRNANSMLYGAVWRAAKAMGYARCITYTQADETGASLRAAGWIRVKALEARKGWAESSVALKDKRDPVGDGGVARVLWECRASICPAESAGTKFAPPPLPPTRMRHRGDKINDQGEVSALCFKRPRAIDMQRASWVLSDSGVTCLKCLRVMRARKGGAA